MSERRVFYSWQSDLPNPTNRGFIEDALEAGYAAGKLGWERIILVANMAFGPIESLPFDLRTRRVLGYTLPVDGHKEPSRSALSAVLKGTGH